MGCRRRDTTAARRLRASGAGADRPRYDDDRDIAEACDALRRGQFAAATLTLIFIGYKSPLEYCRSGRFLADFHAGDLYYSFLLPARIAGR